MPFQNDSNRPLNKLMLKKAFILQEKMNFFPHKMQHLGMFTWSNQIVVNVKRVAFIASNELLTYNGIIDCLNQHDSTWAFVQVDLLQLSFNSLWNH